MMRTDEAPLDTIVHDREGADGPPIRPQGRRQVTGAAPSPRLPPPPSAAHAVSAELTTRIRHAIEDNQGCISFRRYMEMALYEPGLGYYSAGARKFGADGDFITAPELSPLFSRCLARQCAEVLERLGGGEILELGAGTGVMAADLLEELERMDVLPRRYRILEVSADLRERQRACLAARLPAYRNRIEWLSSLPREAFTGLVLANEVMDALPVQRMILTQDGVHELKVAWRDGGLCWQPGQADAGLRECVTRVPEALREAWPVGYTTEFNPQLKAWIRSLAGVLERGVMLLIDYGYPRHEYYHPQRSGGTLLCHYRHRAHSDPFLYPGLQDLSASVDFTALAEAAVEAGLELAGYTTQAWFLLSCGLEDLMHRAAAAGESEQREFARQARVLTMPGDMGERFRVMALGRDAPAGWSGFRLRDQRHHL